MRPLVSVILPTYNRAAFLREAIDSVLAQTWQRWELIIVEDGSTDGTRPYLTTLADPRIHVLELAHNGNRARLRNRGIARARGEYLAFLDSDDFWIPTKLERQVTDLIARNRRWGYAHYRYVDDAGASLPIPRANEWTACDGWILPEVLSGAARIAMPTVIVERSLMAQAGGFDESFLSVEDYEAWIRLAARDQAALIPEPLAVVRLHAGNVSHQSGIAVSEDLARVYRRLLENPDFRPLRRLCRERYAVASRVLAARYRGARRHRRAVQIALRALPYAPAHRDSWVELSKSLVAPLVPPAMLGLYRRARARPPI